MQRTGFFEMCGPVDLLNKIGHDYQRLKAAPGDSYAAFDFFVTATHMHEWWQRSGVGWTPPTDPKEVAIFRLCGDLGNGAKHCVMECKGIADHEVAYNPEYAGIADGDWARGVLILHLEAEDSTLFGMPSFPLVRLAASVLQYWACYEHKRRFPLSFTEP